MFGRRMAPVMGCALILLAAACGSSTDNPSESTSSATGAGGFQSQHKGGTLHLQAVAAGGSLDPQINYTLQYWQLYQTTYDGLLAFKKVNGQDSFTIVPDLVQAMPKITNGGKT